MGAQMVCKRVSGVCSVCEHVSGVWMRDCRVSVAECASGV